MVCGCFPASLPRYGAARPDRDLPSATGADPALVAGIGDVQERPVDAVGPHGTGEAGYSWVVPRTRAENRHVRGGRGCRRPRQAGCEYLVPSMAPRPAPAHIPRVRIGGPATGIRVTDPADHDVVEFLRRAGPAFGEDALDNPMWTESRPCPPRYPGKGFQGGLWSWLIVRHEGHGSAAAQHQDDNDDDNDDDDGAQTYIHELLFPSGSSIHRCCEEPGAPVKAFQPAPVILLPPCDMHPQLLPGVEVLGCTFLRRFLIVRPTYGQAVKGRAMVSPSSDGRPGP